MAYRIIFNAHATRAFRKLSADVKARLKPAIDELVNNPRPPGVEKLMGTESTYRIRVSDYRILYEIHDDKLLIVVVETAHRREVYRKR
ncbi:MAG TPA: type II toxin-antitoxin system RelE/ParE family toxin [Candidatus Hydrogenedentes bacterium]|nr:type II toxin-antitoxin system RelE/ParE family toxin [Candidatus Hydrogenedentota bacterium]